MARSQISQETPEASGGHGPWQARLRQYAAERIIRPSLARPPYRAAIRLCCVSLALGCVSVLSAFWSPRWTEPLIGSGGKRLSVVGIVSLLVALASAVGALGVITAGARRARLWLAVIAVTSVGVVASVHAGALKTARSLGILLSAYPSVGFEIVTVPMWALVVASLSMVAAASVLLLPLARITAHPVRYGLIVSAPVWTVLLIWACLSHDPNRLPAQLLLSAAGRERLDAPPSAAALQLLNDYLFMAVAGAVFIFSLLTAVEVSDANVTTAKQTVRWRHAAPRSLLVAFLLAKATFLALGFAGVFGASQALVWDPGVWGEWVVAGALVSLACWGYARSRSRPLTAGHLRPITTLLVIGFGLHRLMILALPYFQAVSTAVLPGSWQDRVTEFVMKAALRTAHHDLQGTVIACGLVGLVLLAKGRRTDGAFLAVSVFLVGLPLAVQMVDPPISNSLVSLPVLDVAEVGSRLPRHRVHGCGRSHDWPRATSAR